MEKSSNENPVADPSGTPPNPDRAELPGAAAPRGANPACDPPDTGGSGLELGRRPVPGGLSRRRERMDRPSDDSRRHDKGIYRNHYARLTGQRRQYRSEDE